MGEGDDFGKGQPPVICSSRQRPEHRHVGGNNEQQTPNHRLLAQPRRFVLECVQSSAAVDETVDGPTNDAEQAHFLGGRRVNGEPKGVVGVALRTPHLVRVAVAPDPALTQQPVGCEPRASQDEGRPPRVGKEHNGARETTDHLHEPAGNEIHGNRQRWTGHPKIEVACDRELAGQVGILEVTNARWQYACLSEPIVEPCSGAVAKIGADRVVDRSEHLKQDEHGAGYRERAGQAVSALDRANEQTHGNGECRGQHAPQDEHEPPRRGEGGVGLWEDAEELPFVALTQRPKYHSFLQASITARAKASRDADDFTRMMFCHALIGCLLVL